MWPTHLLIGIDIKSEEEEEELEEDEYHSEVVVCLSIHYVRFFVRGLYTRVTTLGCLAIIKNR
jgi:hypothetical protein